MATQVQAFIDHEINKISGLNNDQKFELGEFAGALVRENKANTLLEQLSLLEFALATMETLAARSGGLGAVEGMMLSAAETIFRKLDGDLAANTEIADKARMYKTDKTFREATRDLLEKAGFSRKAIENEAQRLSLDVTLATSRLSTFASRRQLTALKSFHMAQKLVKKNGGRL